MSSKPNKLVFAFSFNIGICVRKVARHFVHKIGSNKSLRKTHSDEYTFQKKNSFTFKKPFQKQFSLWYFFNKFYYQTRECFSQSGFSNSIFSINFTKSNILKMAFRKAFLVFRKVAGTYNYEIENVSHNFLWKFRFWKDEFYYIQKLELNKKNIWIKQRNYEQ